MQIKVDKSALMEALTLSKGSVDVSNPANIVYESVLFTADRDGVWVTATDGSIWSRVLVKAECRGGTPTLIKSSQLTDIVAGLDDGYLEISSDGHRATLKSGRYRAEFGVADAIEFPAFPELGDYRLTDIDAMTFAGMIKSVEGSAGTKADRPYLCGINFGLIDGDLRAVAIDGHRIAISRVPCLGWTGEEGVSGPTLPDDHSSASRLTGQRVESIGTCGSRLARQWVSLASLMGHGESIRFGFHEGWGFIMGGDAMIAGVLPDQRYPDWEGAALFPKPADKRRKVSFDRKALAKSVKRVTAIGSRMKIPVSIDIDLDEYGVLMLESHASSGRSARDRLEGNATDAGFSAPARRRVDGGMLLQALSTLKASDVVLSITIDGRQPIGLEGGRESHYLMPRS
jgi:DNA polymerase III sliding clamp (beta) subunit (PCNA family)